MVVYLQIFLLKGKLQEDGEKRKGKKNIKYARNKNCVHTPFFLSFLLFCFSTFVSFFLVVLKGTCAHAVSKFNFSEGDDDEAIFSVMG